MRLREVEMIFHDGDVNYTELGIDPELGKTCHASKAMIDIEKIEWFNESTMAGCVTVHMVSGESFMVRSTYNKFKELTNSC